MISTAYLTTNRINNMKNHGGNKRCNGLFGYMYHHKFRVGLRHRTMTRIERLRFKHKLIEWERKNR